jgi:hypothetical protein
MLYIPDKTWSDYTKDTQMSKAHGKGEKNPNKQTTPHTGLL